MVNVRQITTATKGVAAWVKASGKTNILQTKPQINIDFNKIKYITPQFDKNFSVENLVKNYLQSKEFPLPTTRNTKKII